MAQERILVIQLRQLGDILLTTPVFRAIKKERPRAVVTFLSHEMGRMVAYENPYVDEHFFYGPRDGYLKEWRLAAELRERGFTRVYDFMNNPRSALYTRATGAPVRMGFRSSRWWAYTESVPRPAGDQYIVDQKFSLLRADGWSPEDLSLDLPWFEVNSQPLLKLWAEHPEFRDAPFRVALSPTHRREVRRWPLARYAKIAERLVQEWGASVIWLWGPGEEELIDDVMKRCRETTLKAPPTRFREMAALVANCDLFVGNSNGPSHVAVANRICSLQLHGPTKATSWCPCTEKHRALQARKKGPGKGLMTAIGLDQVWNELTAMKPVVEAYRDRVHPQRPLKNWREIKD